MNPRCVRSTQIGLFLTQCFLENAEFVHSCAAWMESRRQKAASYFFGLFYNKQIFVFMVNVHK